MRFIASSIVVWGRELLGINDTIRTYGVASSDGIPSWVRDMVEISDDCGVLLHTSSTSPAIPHILTFSSD